MDSEKKTFIQLLTLLVLFELTESKGVCQFAEMFPSKGRESCFQGKAITIEDKAPVTNGKSVNPTTVQQEASPAATPQTNSSATSSELAATECPPNTVYGNCSCQFSCDDPPGRNTTSCNDQCLDSETCVCAEGFLKKGDDCVTPSACGCYITETDWVIPNKETYISATCSEKCVCQDDQLICNTHYECSPNATCWVKDGVRQCYCNEGYVGDGETCRPMYKDCYDAYEAGQRQNGVFTILPAGWPRTSFDVYCDMDTTEGGWTVFQRRVDGVTDFYRNWASYRNGFGSIQQGNDFWLGNEQLYYLTNTNQRSYKLRIDIVTSDGTSKFSEYASFRIDSESTKYQLVDLGSYVAGNAGDDILVSSVNKRFSTYDNVSDGCGALSCAEKHRGAWWYTSIWCSNCYSDHICDRFLYYQNCRRLCTTSNLNGQYSGGYGQNIFWRSGGILDCNLNSAEMKIRPVM